MFTVDYLFRPRLAAALILVLALLALIAACGPSAPAVKYRAPTYAEITPGPKKYVSDLSTTVDLPPFPYSAPLPPAVPSSLDGLYVRTIPMEGTPTPCKRCAGYRIEGGVWSLYLNKGVFKVFQQDTDFEAVGSFTVTGDRLSVFNDPYCEENLQMVGNYSWVIDGDALTLKAIDDPCSIGLRAKNLTATTWVRAPEDSAQRAIACQPPSREAAVSDHWKKPIYCR